MPRRSVRTRRRAMGGFLSFVIGALAIAIVALLCVIALSDRFRPAGRDADVQGVPPADGDNYVDANDLPESEMVLKSDTFADEYLPGRALETATPTPAPDVTPTPRPRQMLENGEDTAQLRPTAIGEGMLPIFKKANTNNKVIAITLDECSDIKLMESFVKLARHYDAKLTLFPTGEAIMKNGMGTLLKTCLTQDGFEIENRGYSEMARLYQYVDSLMVQEIWKQSIALNFVLGARYQPHFYRLYGGLGETDPRTHAYLKQQGYLGIAHWTTSCTGMDPENIPDKLTPGGIYAFRCSQEDGQRMFVLMSAAKRAGYRMVTLNQLFGYHDNEIVRATGSLLSDKMPEFSYDTSDYANLFPGDCCWAVARMQQRLTDLGYLPEGSSDGMFGEKTSIALRAFQTQIHTAASGSADVATQKALFAKDAPMNSIPLSELFKEDGEDPYGNAEDGNPFSEPGEEDETPGDDAPSEAEEKPKNYTMLRRGTRGEAVKQLQQALIATGAMEGEPDGQYGKQTADAVRKLQKTWGYKANGMAGPKFQKRLFEEAEAAEEAGPEAEEAEEAQADAPELEVAGAPEEAEEEPLDGEPSEEE